MIFYLSFGGTLPPAPSPKPEEQSKKDEKMEEVIKLAFQLINHDQRIY